MKRFSLLIFVMALISGCFKEPVTLPSVDIDSFQDVTLTNEVCYYRGIPFDHYTFQGNTLSDSIQWYQYISGDTIFLGTGFTMDVATFPYPNFIYRSEFHGNDTVFGSTGFGLCYHALYNPNAFTPIASDGINDQWYPLFYNTEPIWSMSWRILTTNGEILFEANTPEDKWDGEGMSPGPYIYAIQIEIPNEETRQYSGVVHLLD